MHYKKVRDLQSALINVQTSILIQSDADEFYY